LLDEHVNPAFIKGLNSRCSEMVVWRIGDPAAPILGSPDPEILLWCEKKDFILITNNRASMPVHLTNHLAVGNHVPGIFILNNGLSMGDHIDELEYIWSASEPDEFRDVIWYLPIKR